MEKFFQLVHDLRRIINSVADGVVLQYGPMLVTLISEMITRRISARLDLRLLTIE